MSTPLSHARTRAPRFAESAVERARLTVVPRRAQKAPKVPFLTLVSVLLVGGVVGLLLFNTSMQQASFTATALEARATALDAKEQSLQMTLDRMRDPQRVAVRAQRLGMVPSDNPAFIRLSDGTVVGDPQAAEPGDTMRITPQPTRKPKNLRPDPVPAPPAADTGAQNRHDTASASPDHARRHGKKNAHAQPERQGSDR